MLRSLQIRNYVLIDSLEIDFPEGLIIISGQTGAGKSILLGALSLLLGAKADQSVIGADAGNCLIEASFSIPSSDSSLRMLLEENDIEMDGESGELVIRRMVARTGRSRSFVNDVPVTVQTLQSIGSRLVDVHSQHQTLLLADKSFQLSVLDHFAGNAALLEMCGQAYSRIKVLEKEIAAVKSILSRLSAEKDYNEVRFRRLDEARLQEGELESLESEQKQLANAEEIKESLSTVEEMFIPSDPLSDRSSLSSMLKEAQKMLDRVGRFIPKAKELAERMDSARAEMDDILGDVSMMNSQIELSQDRLAEVEGRMSLIYDLLKAYSESTVSGLISQREALAKALFDSSELEERKKELEGELQEAEKEYSGISRSLRDARMKASEAFSSTLCGMLGALELDHSVFRVEIRESTPSPSGEDSVTFLFSASGSNPLDVAKCASGGEMSRLMLCLKALMARFVNMPTLIFDEIDTGVSGSVADKMGQMICRMGQDMQIFAITHLPQVAAKGSAHYLVEKEYDVLGTKATTSVRQIKGQERVLEIARMLSGSQVSAAAVENAKSLLSD